MAKADLHCHSLYSDRPAYWILRKMGARECYTTPEDLYRCLKSRGMDFVTITDHDTIEGARELAATHDDAFVSCEFTVSFPTGQAEAHICAYDITEEDFCEACRLRHDLAAFAGYFRERRVVTCVAHPFHSKGGNLDVGHLEQMLLLFDAFEEINGLQMHAAGHMERDFLDKLSPELLDELGRKHGIRAATDEPWRKGRVGGSDDHFGFYLGRCWTEVPGAGTYKDFLRGIRDRRSVAHGQGMTPLEFAHATQFVVVSAVMDRRGKAASLEDRLRRMVSLLKIPSRDEEETGNTTSPSGGIPPFAVDMLVENWRDTDVVFGRTPGVNLQEDTFDLISTLFNTLCHDVMTRLGKQWRQGLILEAISSVSQLMPAVLAATPYVMAYRHVHADHPFRVRIADQYGLTYGLDRRPEKWAWFTDTLLDMNGVTRIIRRYAALAEARELPLTVVTCHQEEPTFPGRVVNFEPLYCFPLPEYESMVFALPPLLDVLRFCEREQFTRFIISTPGPVGLVALWVARMLQIPTSGIYHTDLPSYVRRLTGDRFMEDLAWRLVRLVYGNADRVYVLSEASRNRLLQNGMDHNDLRLFPKGTDVRQFNAARRNPEVWRKWGLRGEVRILYVGRISVEKDLDVLEQAYRRICQQHGQVDLLIVGEGPYLEELRRQMADLSAVAFAGTLEGDALVEVFASADIFAFPSTTDTYGSVILEAQASGLPVVVTDEGGPCEVIRHGETGLVARAADPQSFAEALWTLIENADLRKTMGQRGRAHVAPKTWENAFQAFVDDQRRTR